MTTHHFRYHSRQWQLFKRGTAANPPGDSTPWSIRITVREDGQSKGKRVLKSLRSASKDIAIARAKKLIDSEARGEYVTDSQPEPETKRRVPTFGEVFDIYEERATNCRPLSRQRNISQTARMLRTVTGSKTPRDLPVSILTADLAKLWQARKQELKHPSYTDIKPGNVDANSVLRQARSLFGVRALEIYPPDFEFPDSLKGFMRVPILKQGSHRYRPIPNSTLDAMNEGARKLRDENLEMWIVHMMMRTMGLRASEVEHAKGEWLIESGDQLQLEIIPRNNDSHIPKGHEGRVAVPKILDPFFRIRRSGYLVAPNASSPSARHILIYRDHSKWLRTYLPDRQKTNHELRKHAGSLVAQKYNSWEAAARFLREDLDTAKSHYLELLNPISIEIDDLEIEAPSTKKRRA